jgi:hypothetical protein
MDDNLFEKRVKANPVICGKRCLALDLHTGLDIIPDFIIG